MKKSRYILLLFLSVSIFSCETEDSEDVNQDRIFATYELFYNKNEDKTTATAIFTFGNRTGTRLELSEGSFVEFNNSQIPFNDLLGAYIIEFAGVVNEGNFLFMDLDQQSYSNSVSLEPIALPSLLPSSINRNESFELVWEGESINTQGSAVIATLLPNNIAQTKIFTQSAISATSVVIETNVLQEIDAQPGNLFLERINEINTQESNSAGGIIIAKYRTENASVSIE